MRLVFGLLFCLAVVQSDSAPWAGFNYNKPAAVYASSNNPAGNQIYVYNVNPANGALNFSQAVSTGGNGNGSPHSDFSLVTSGNYLLAANGGSNSISLFAITPSQPSHITLLGQATVQGDFPTSIATTNAYGSLACVATSSGDLKISCFNFGPGGLTYFPQWTRDLGISITNNSVPLSQISFSPQGRALIVQFKGLSVAYLVYPIVNGALASQPYITNANTPIGPSSYGFQFGSNYYGTTIVANDAAQGQVRALSFNSSGSFVNQSNSYSILNATGSAALCWIVTSPLTHHYYAIGAGSSSVTEVGFNRYNQLAEYKFVNQTSLGGLTDGVVIHSASGCDWLYILSKLGGVSLWKIEGSGQLTYDSTYAYPTGLSNSTMGGISGYPLGVTSSN